MSIKKQIENNKIVIISERVDWVVIYVDNSDSSPICAVFLKEKMLWGENVLLDKKESSEVAQMFIEATRISKLSEEKFDEECKTLTTAKAKAS